MPWNVLFIDIYKVFHVTQNVHENYMKSITTHFHAAVFLQVRKMHDNILSNSCSIYMPCNNSSNVLFNVVISHNNLYFCDR